MNDLPPLFLDRLKRILPPEHYDAVVKSFAVERKVSLRVNTLKMVVDTAREWLTAQHIPHIPVSWALEGVVLKADVPVDVGELALVRQGALYRQALSSMLPVVVLDPQPGEQVLDACAAPGSKATQIAARMNNTGKLVAVEAVRKRFYKLKSICELTGAENIELKFSDARRLSLPPSSFDRVLADVPCSSEGRFRAGHPRSIGYWSPRKIREMVRKQKGIALSASRFLKSGGVMVYSTCTFAPEENEGVVDWLLRKTQGALSVEGIAVPGIPSYPALTAWEDQFFDPQVSRCLRVLPGPEMEGFFIAKLRKTCDRD